MLEGTEVKALRGGAVQIKDGYAAIRDGELWLHNVHIPPYGPAARDNHEPERPRKLLAHRREIERLIGRVQERGLTLVPTRIYFKDGRAKVEIALARGKDRFDKRETIRRDARDAARHGRAGAARRQEAVEPRRLRRPLRASSSERSTYVRVHPDVRPCTSSATSAR